VIAAAGTREAVTGAAAGGSLRSSAAASPGSGPQIPDSHLPLQRRPLLVLAGAPSCPDLQALEREGAQSAREVVA